MLLFLRCVTTKWKAVEMASSVELLILKANCMSLHGCLGLHSFVSTFLIGRTIGTNVNRYIDTETKPA